MNVYPIFLSNLAGARCVVFGGGPAHETERKVDELLDREADVTFISPDASEGLRRRAEEGRLTWLRRTYQPGDLAGAFLAIVTRTDPAATEPIWQEARSEKVLLNAMDDPPHCDFVAGSVLRRGSLTIATSTGGAAPALAVRIRQHLETTFGPEYGPFLDLMRTLRPAMAARYPDFDERRARWYALVDAGLPELLREGDLDAATERIAGVAGPEVAAAVPGALSYST